MQEEYALGAPIFPSESKKSNAYGRSYAIIIQHVTDLWLPKPNRDPRVFKIENGVKILNKVQTAAQGLTLLQSALKI